MLSAVDGDIKGDGIDKFRIKIWDKATDSVVYDNEMGIGDDAESTTGIGGGSIKIHTVKAAPPHSRFADRGAALPSGPTRGTARKSAKKGIGGHTYFFMHLF